MGSHVEAVSGAMRIIASQNYWNNSSSELRIWTIRVMSLLEIQELDDARVNKSRVAFLVEFSDGDRNGEESADC